MALPRVLDSVTRADLDERHGLGSPSWHQPDHCESGGAGAGRLWGDTAVCRLQICQQTLHKQLAKALTRQRPCGEARGNSFIPATAKLVASKTTEQVIVAAGY